ncbi:FAD binding domain protein [Decorospora gaudefroyi]|uniref:FAD binding domain protein n=1 Tax=Decorospora gaudefroyi TaxID=184978 RepID=A0A6A5K2R2_9PLEO|nr:FAD binding domain protein [Decorospora gaudefroyi]
MASLLLLYLLSFQLLASSLTTTVLAHSSPPNNKTCHCSPNEPCWPTPQEWSTLNTTLQGRLIPTTPIGTPCHHPFYNEPLCTTLQSTYTDPTTHFQTSSSPMAPFWANRSCDPFAAPATPCKTGTYVAYAVRVESVSDITATLAFVRAKNIRLVIRNTGHDYLGKSTGKAALALWMHHLRGFDVLDAYTSQAYTGKAVKIAAGMMSDEVSARAHAHGLTVVGGNCASIGLAGGYTQGGGLGLLTSRYGFGADQVLEWEVVRVDGGELVKATPRVNPDLYWALSGGGGGTFGIVVSMTVKAYPEERSAAANLSFSSSGVALDVFYGAVAAFQNCLPALSEAGGVAIYVVQGTVFALSPAMLPGGSKESLDALIEPALVKLRSLNMSYAYTSMESPSYHEAYHAMVSPSETAYFQIGSRVLPQHTLTENSHQLTQAIRKVNSYGAGVGGLSFQAPNPNKPTRRNSVNPKFRSSAVSVTVGTIWSNTDWDLNLANQELMTNVLIPAIDRVAPGWSTAYLNEVDHQEPEWQKVIYGDTYSRLLSLKTKFDPDHILWGRTAVGSEAKTETADGKLCRT